MTEQDWLECGDPLRMLDCDDVARILEWHDPLRMLESVRGRVSDRKLLLFGIAYNERLLPFIHLMGRAKQYEARLRQSLASCARVAEGLATPEEMEHLHPPDSLFSAHGYARGCAVNAPQVFVNCKIIELVRKERTPRKRQAPRQRSEPRGAALHTAELALQCRLLRCIFGNPFRPVSLAPAVLEWNDGTLPRLAQAIYDERAFDRLPVLADALEDAGAHDTQLLIHCRQPGEHVRGCWVLDLILQKN